MSRTITAESQECKLTLQTPFEKIETDTYMVFTKKNGMNNIEVNNFTIDDVMAFAKELDGVILNYIRQENER